MREWRPHDYGSKGEAMTEKPKLDEGLVSQLDECFDRAGVGHGNHNPDDFQPLCQRCETICYIKEVFQSRLNASLLALREECCEAACGWCQENHPVRYVKNWWLDLDGKSTISGWVHTVGTEATCEMMCDASDIRSLPLPEADEWLERKIRPYRENIAAAYQLAGAVGAPVEYLDNFSCLANGQEAPHAGLPPITEVAEAQTGRGAVGGSRRVVSCLRSACGGRG